jgi:hypothetical protein
MSRNVTASLSWIGIASLNVVSLFTIFGPTKLINISKFVGDIFVKFFELASNFFKLQVR